MITRRELWAGVIGLCCGLSALLVSAGAGRGLVFFLLACLLVAAAVAHVWLCGPRDDDGHICRLQNEALGHVLNYLRRVHDGSPHRNQFTDLVEIETRVSDGRAKLDINLLRRARDLGRRGGAS